MNVEWSKITPGYFATLKMPLLAGRDVAEQDRRGAQKVAVVNESFARQYFGDPRKAIGQYFGGGAGNVKVDIQIVGVVSDVKHTNVREPVDRTVYLPVLQEEPEGGRSFGMAFYVRTWQTPESAESSIRQAMHTLDSKLVLNDFRTMQEQIDEVLSGERVVAFLASSFGLLCALMAAIGIYGVLAYTTVQRTREFGIRLALGATHGAVVRIVLAEVVWLAGIGIVAGLPVSLLFAYVVRSLLYGVSKSDPLTLCIAVVSTILVALAAAALSSRRATKVDPIIALRYE